MKYAIRYYRECRVLDQVDEIIIKYKDVNEDLIKFVQSRPDWQRVIVDILELPPEQEKKSIEIFAAAVTAHPNFAVMTFFDEEDRNYIEDLEKAGIPYFFRDGVGTLDNFMFFTQFNVTDICIIGELGFCLDKVSSICKQKNIKVRVFPCYATTSSLHQSCNFKSFFIRPDDINAYEKYVDVFDLGFLYMAESKQAVLFDVYKSGKWLGDLNEIIEHLNCDIDNTTILPNLGKMRATCEKRCVFDRCNFCDRISEVAELMRERDLGLRKT